MDLTPHFSLREMTESDYALRHSLHNIPGAGARASLKRLCVEVLEPLREWAGPVVITSGFRAPQVNRGIGSNDNSAHVEGRAADLRVPGRDLAEVYEWIAGSGLPVDQQIYEYDSWIHVAIARAGSEPRRQMLRKEQGKHSYEPYYVAVRT